MRKAVLFIYIITLCQCLKAQQSGIDSVIRLMRKSDNEKLTQSRYQFLAGHYHQLKNDSMAIVYVHKSIDLAVKHGWTRDELGARFILINTTNQTEALTQAIYCLRLAESSRDTVGIINTYFLINIIYSGAQEYGKALQYSHMMLDISAAASDDLWHWNSLYAVANAYISLEKADSGLFYAQEAYRHALALTNFTQRWVFDQDYQFPKEQIIAWSLHALGRAQQLLKDDQLAISYFAKGLSFASSDSSDKRATVSIYSSIAQSFLNLSQIDSVIKYCHLYLGKDTLVPDVIPIYIYLAKAYERKNSDSAVTYYRMAVEKREKYFSVKSREVVVDLTRQEEERRAQMNKVASELKEARNRNLQFSFLGIGLVTFCIVYLLISQTIVVKSGLVKFLGVLALLLVFEFINLFLHPLIENLTHHSQVSMFLIMVGIAALLVPAHHRLEKWITNKLVAKNKRIRLEAAKKTVAKLEGNL